MTQSFIGYVVYEQCSVNNPIIEQIKRQSIVFIKNVESNEMPTKKKKNKQLHSLLFLLILVQLEKKQKLP